MPKHAPALTSLLTLIAACAAPRAADGGPTGITFVNVQIVDGTGSRPVPGSLRIAGDTIVAVGTVSPARGDSVIDGHGLVIAPGFIDTHSHHASGLSTMPAAEPVVSQGITTIIAGQDGGQPFPLAPTLDSLRQRPPAVNVGYYAGHNTIREAVLGSDFRRVATPAEVDSMATLLRRELDAGALGLSSGLEYDPGIYSDRTEVLTLAKVTAAAGGRYISHIRSEDRFFWNAIDEVVAIGREARMPVQVSHMKLGMLPLWGMGDSLVARLEAARASGVDITADVYPYTYWQSTLTVLFPKRDFSNRAEAVKILRDIAKPEGLLIGDYAANHDYRGRTVAQIADLRHEDPATTLMALIADAQAWEQAHPNATENSESVVATSMSESDVGTLLSWKHANISSDGSMNGAHPRGYGAFPRVLGEYVRAQHAISLEDAVRKMTSLAAAHVGLKRRGTLAPGAYADLVIFDPSTVGDRATPAAPHALSVGIESVWVNGRAVWASTGTTSARPGRVLRRTR